jgi:hypothetical protein
MRSARSARSSIDSSIVMRSARFVLEESAEFFFNGFATANRPPIPCCELMANCPACQRLHDAQNQRLCA